jgi:hypothetical protein
MTDGSLVRSIDGQRSTCFILVKVSTLSLDIDPHVVVRIDISKDKLVAIRLLAVHGVVSIIRQATIPVGAVAFSGLLKTVAIWKEGGFDFIKASWITSLVSKVKSHFKAVNLSGPLLNGTFRHARWSRARVGRVASTFTIPIITVIISNQKVTFKVACGTKVALRTGGQGSRGQGQCQGRKGSR